MPELQPMYAQFFSLAELPFRITPDPRFLWYSPQHRDAKAKIIHHITTRKGPIFLYADVGTGKTSISKRIREELAESASNQVVSVYAPNLKTSNAFLRFLMEEFAVKTDRNYAVSLKNFEQFLIDRFQAGVTLVILIDEAQNLTRDMLKLVHHLFNFATNTEFLIQVALFGQQELHDKIFRYESLRSRMTPATLKPFTEAETGQMLAFRWQVAGGSGFPFPAEAIAEIHRLSGGNPRDICKLTDATLLQAFVARHRSITRQHVILAAPEAFISKEGP